LYLLSGEKGKRESRESPGLMNELEVSSEF
jgi:hypothetical protein